MRGPLIGLVGLLLLASTSAAGTAAAQRVRVGSTSGDTLRILEIVGRLSAAEVRELADQLATIRTREGELLRAMRDAEEVRRATIRDELAQVSLELQPLQTKLMLACTMLRSSRPDREGYLGISSGPEFELQAVRPGVRVLTSGRPLRVEFVEPGSPAFLAGVRAGDEWISINERMVAEVTESDFDRMLKPGTRLPLEVRRGDRTLRLAVTVGKRPDFPEDACGSRSLFAFSFMPAWDQFAQRGAMVRAAPRRGVEMRFGSIISPGSVISISPNRVTTYGMTVRTIDDADRDVLSINGDGVLVDAVLPGTAAERAGLKRYDVIVQVNGQVATTGEILRQSATERELKLDIVFKGQRRTVTLARQ